MNEAITALYVICAFADVLLLMRVIRQAQHDLHLKRNDASSVLKERKRSFFAAAFFLLLTTYFKDDWLALSPPVVGIVGIGFILSSAYILMVSSVSLEKRAPRSGHTYRIPSGVPWRRSR